MRMTYEEIIDSMRKAFFEECGKNPQELPEIDVRFKSVATELYALSTYSDFVFQQTFASTATGEYLDYHGELVGLTRKTGSTAQGMLTFSLSEPAEKDITVPSETFCSVAGKPFLQFYTTEAAVIPSGALSVTVPAVSLGHAPENNAAADTVTVIVNPPAYVAAVTNAQAFSGACSDESDAAFRARILDSRRVPRNGVNAVSLANIIMQKDEVLDCLIAGCSSENTVQVYVKTRHKTVNDALRSSIADTLGICRLAGCTLQIDEAQANAVRLICDVQVYAGCDTASAAAQVREAVYQYCSAEKIGRSLSLSGLAAALSDIEGIVTYTVHSPAEQNGEIACKTGEYLVVSSVEVNCFV